MSKKRDPRLEREFAIFQKNYGLVVKKLRLKAKLSQAALAKKAKINVSTVAMIERGHGNPGITRMIRIAEALKMHLSRIFKLAQDMKGRL